MEDKKGDFPPDWEKVKGSLILGILEFASCVSLASLAGAIGDAHNVVRILLEIESESDFG